VDTAAARRAAGGPARPRGGAVRSAGGERVEVLRAEVEHVGGLVDEQVLQEVGEQCAQVRVMCRVAGVLRPQLLLSRHATHRHPPPLLSVRSTSKLTRNYKRKFVTL